MPDDRQRSAEVDPLGSGFEDLARSIHASYLDRWGRHDPAGLEHQIDAAVEAGAEDSPVSAA